MPEFNFNIIAVANKLFLLLFQYNWRRICVITQLAGQVFRKEWNEEFIRDYYMYYWRQKKKKITHVAIKTVPLF